MSAFELSQDLEKELLLISEQTGKSLDELITDALNNYLEEMEEQQDLAGDTEDARLIQERLELWEKQGCPGISPEEYARTRSLGRNE
ncbi:MAG: hypothetical protein H7833_14190 [Magnetococcus sp. DMHC-1]